MAHPYKSAAHRNDPKWLGALNRATGGAVIRTLSGRAPDPADQDNSNPSRFSGTSDFDNRNVGEAGPDFREAQTDETGLSRRLSAKNRTSDNDAADERLFPQREDRPMRYKRGGRAE